MDSRKEMNLQPYPKYKGYDSFVKTHLCPLFVVYEQHHAI